MLRYFIIHPSVLQELVCPGAEPRWSLAELVHAVLLMAHAHSLCSFVWGCGLNPEPDHIGGYTFHPPSPTHLPHSPHSPAHEDGRHEVSPKVIFHHRSDKSKMSPGHGQGGFWFIPALVHQSLWFSNSRGPGLFHIFDLLLKKTKQSTK